MLTVKLSRARFSIDNRLVLYRDDSSFTQNSVLCLRLYLFEQLENRKRNGLILIILLFAYHEITVVHPCF